jgi:beta-mannanase
MGLYIPNDWCSAVRAADEYQILFGRRIRILSFYEAWGQADQPPDLTGIESVIENGYTPMITWEPWQRRQSSIDSSREPWDQPPYSLAALASGTYDDYIRIWALSLKRLSAPVFFRPMHEMNGDWYPWCGTVNGNRPVDFITAWRHIRSIFRKTNSDKLVWVWSPYAESVPDEPGNKLRDYFPGEEEVDWLALDGYNWGSTRAWSRWQGFSEIFRKGYKQLIRLSLAKPVMIGELGCTEEGGDKSDWIREASEALKYRFTGIKGLIWFNVNKECDWRIESSPESVGSFRIHWAES